LHPHVRCAGPNTDPDRFKGVAINFMSNIIGEAGHRYLGIDPSTGRIIGSIAGNVLFELGGKDNSLGNIGKVVLDNIISGKWTRKVG
jgi:calpain